LGQLPNTPCDYEFRIANCAGKHPVDAVDLLSRDLTSRNGPAQPFHEFGAQKLGPMLCMQQQTRLRCHRMAVNA